MKTSQEGLCMDNGCAGSYKRACFLYALLAGPLLDYILMDRLSYRMAVPDWVPWCGCLPAIIVVYWCGLVSIRCLKARCLSGKKTGHWQSLVAVVLSGLLLGVLWYKQGGLCMSVDFQFRQLPEIQTHSYSTMHPVAHTMLCGFIIDVFRSITAIAVVQALYYLAALYILCRFMGRLSLSFPFAAACSLLTTWLAAPEILLIIKDAFYIPSFLLLATALCAYPLGWKKFDPVYFCIGLIGVGTMRHDGLSIVAVLAALFLPVCIRAPKMRCTVGVPLGVALAVIVFCVAALPRMVQAASEATGTAWAMPAAIICEIVAENGDISPEEMEEIETCIMPRHVILGQHDALPDSHGEKYIWPTLFPTLESGYRYSFCWALSGKSQEVLSLFSRLAWKNPGIVCRFLARNADMLWNPGPSCRMPAFYLFPLSFLCTLIAFTRLPLVYRLPLVPILCNVAVVVFVATTYEFRYITPAVASLPLMLAYVRHLVCLESAHTPESPEPIP